MNQSNSCEGSLSSVMHNSFGLTGNTDCHSRNPCLTLKLSTDVTFPRKPYQSSVVSSQSERMQSSHCENGEGRYQMQKPPGSSLVVPSPSKQDSGNHSICLPLTSSPGFISREASPQRCRSISSPPYTQLQQLSSVRNEAGSPGKSRNSFPEESPVHQQPSRVLFPDTTTIKPGEEHEKIRPCEPAVQHVSRGRDSSPYPGGTCQRDYDQTPRGNRWDDRELSPPDCDTWPRSCPSKYTPDRSVGKISIDIVSDSDEAKGKEDWLQFVNTFSGKFYANHDTGGGSCGSSPASCETTPSPSQVLDNSDLDFRNPDGEALSKVAKPGTYVDEYALDCTSSRNSYRRTFTKLKHKRPRASNDLRVKSRSFHLKDKKGSSFPSGDLIAIPIGCQDLIIKKEVFCQVCGDVAAGFYCGAYICEACKKFFVRASRQEKIKYVCHKSENCEITKETRVRCQFCRFQKCLKLEMYSPGDLQAKDSSAGIANIPCRVCGGASSGFHFGALTCEGCKGFFRRMAKEREWNTYRCTKNGDCEISMVTRNVCKACRYRKCLEAGMSVEASRIGRQPNAIKHAISIEARKQETLKLEAKTEDEELELDESARAYPNIEPFKLDVQLDPEQADRNIGQVMEAWKELSALNASDKINYEKHNLSHDSVESTWKMIMVHFEFNARCIIKFSKKLPNFQRLCIEDQVSLIQLATYPLCIINHSQFYNLETKEIRLFDFTKEEGEAIDKYLPEFAAIPGHFQHFGQLMKNHNIDETEAALWSSLALLQSENLNLKEKEKAQQMFSSLTETLYVYMKRNHKPYERRMGLIMSLLRELSVASLQHNQWVGNCARNHPHLENQLWAEMYRK